MNTHKQPIRRIPHLSSLFIFTILVLLMISCVIPCYFGCGNTYNPTNTPPGVAPDQSIQIFYGKGDATTTYIISHGPPSEVTNKCHDTQSYALVKVYTKQQVPKYLEFTHPLAAGEYFFMAEIHPALINPWRNKQCDYAQSESEFGWTQINGVLQTSTSEMTPFYTGDPGCPLNSAKFEWNGSYIFLAYDCVNGNTTYHYTFNMEEQNLPQSTTTKP